MSPGDLARVVKEVISLPSIKSNSLEDITSCIKERSRKKTELDIQIYNTRQKINNLNNEIKRKEKKIQDLEKEEESFKQKNQDQEKDFFLFCYVKEELQKNNICIQDVKQLANIIRIFRDLEFYPQKILNQFSNIENYKLHLQKIDEELKVKGIVLKNLETRLSMYKEEISPHHIMEVALMDLANIGFGLPDFEKFISVIQEIADENQIDTQEVKAILFRLLDEYRDISLLEKLKLEKQNENSLLDENLQSKRDTIKAQPQLFSTLNYLLKNGFTGDHLLSVLILFKKDHLNRKPSNNKEYLNGLSKDLDKYYTLQNTLKDMKLKIVIEESRIDELSERKSSIQDFIYLSLMGIYFNHFLLKLLHRQIQKRFIEIFSVDYAYYLIILCCYKTNESSNVSKKRNKNGKKFAKRKKNQEK
ncbi:MAG TPA: hypothetical protein VK250_06340 [Nitrososphaeraceae archaeon]|nr:hypothetical protein [Nitrososphaeraceae archaeon]